MSTLAVRKGNGGNGGTTLAALSLPAMEKVDETSVPRSLLEELALKIIYLHGEMTLRELTQEMKLSLGVVMEIFQRLRQEQLCEVKGMVGGVYRVATTSAGKARALELLSQNLYTGPAPVSLTDYINRVRAQSVRTIEVRPPAVQQAFSHLVLSERTVNQLGTAIVSGSSVFLHGPTGTGKTSIAETLPKVYEDQVWLPYAVELDGQIITVYDAIVHEALPFDADPENADARWVLCRRPKIITGGELTMEMLDLQYNPNAKFYSAPLQMKANNGVLIIDDFGRQRIRPEELLNRWIVPLDRQIDFLTLMGGKKFEIPFDLFVVFSTNLDPSSLADEAFLRRIHNKILIDNVTREQFHEIFRRVCGKLELNYDPAIVDYLMDKITEELRQPLRPCYPRDIVSQIMWGARYRGEPARLDREAVGRACHNYFLGDQSAAAD